jgi:hypothetical protein
MAINTLPIFSKKGDIQWSAAAMLGANTTKDGTGTVTPVFTAGADGAFVQKIVARPTGTNVATVLRVFINNGATNATAADNSLITELTLPATTLSEVAAQPAYEMPLNFPMPPNYRLLCTLGTAVAAGFEVTVFGGTYTE